MLKEEVVEDIKLKPSRRKRRRRKLFVSSKRMINVNKFSLRDIIRPSRNEKGICSKRK